MPKFDMKDKEPDMNYNNDVQSNREGRRLKRAQELRARREALKPSNPTARQIIEAHAETVEDCKALGAKDIEIGEQIQKESQCSQTPATLARELGRMRQQVKAHAAANPAPVATPPSSTMPEPEPSSMAEASKSHTPEPVKRAEPYFPSTMDSDYSEGDLL